MYFTQFSFCGFFSVYGLTLPWFCRLQAQRSCSTITCPGRGIGISLFPSHISGLCLQIWTPA